jgi:hypothetical protein
MFDHVPHALHEQELEHERERLCCWSPQLPQVTVWYCVSA